MTVAPPPAPPTDAPDDDDEPVSDRHRSYTPSSPEEIRRKLFFGGALLLALASVYAGLLGWGRPIQYGLAGLAVLTVFVALVAGATAPLTAAPLAAEPPASALSDATPPDPKRPILLVATTNPGKLREIRDLLHDVPYEVRSLEGMPDIPAPEETEPTFDGNARLKARYYAKATGLLAVADDSGLEIDALDGRPGVQSAGYPGATYQDRFTNIWREIAASGRPERGARFVCAVALATPEEVRFEARGTVDGQILDAARGTNGFGYDPIFFSPELGKGLAEATLEEKRTVSHRGRAFDHLRAHLLATTRATT